MNPALPLLRPLAIWQGTRLLGSLDELPEPAGARHGIAVGATDVASAIIGQGPGSERLQLVVLGDDLALGIGVTDQQQGAAASLAGQLAARSGRDVVWQVIGESGASSLRVHHRLLELVPARADVVVLAVGLADLMARQQARGWHDEMSAILSLLQTRGEVVVTGCPPVARLPRLRWPLTAALDADARRLDGVTQELCRERGLAFVSLRARPRRGRLPPGRLPPQRRRPPRLGWGGGARGPLRVSRSQRAEGGEARRGSGRRIVRGRPSGPCRCPV